MDEIMVRFGKWLTERAVSRGYTTNSELADRASVSTSQIGRWKAGRMLPSAENMRPLAQALSVPVLELYVRTGWLTEREAGVVLPQREDPDPRILPLLRVLQKIDRLPERDRGVIEGMLRSLDAVVESLDQMQQTFTHHLIGGSKTTG